MNRFKSQHYGDDSPLRRKMGEVMDRYHGKHARVPYAEGFLALEPEVYSLLPLGEFRQKLATTA